MTALPKRQRQHRPTMAEPPPADRCVLCGHPVPPPVLPPFTGDYRACPDIKACTGRMPRGTVPGPGTPPAGTALLPVFTPAMHAQDAAYRDALRAGQAADRDDVTQWHAQACVATFGPLDDWLHHTPLPDMMP